MLNTRFIYFDRFLGAAKANHGGGGELSDRFRVGCAATVSKGDRWLDQFL